MRAADMFLTYLGWLLGSLWPVAAGAVIWLAAGTVWRIRREGQLSREIMHAWLLLGVPVVVLAWGALAYGWAEGPRSDWPSWVVLALALLEPALLVRITWRNPKTLGFLLPVGAAGLILTALAAFISGMSVVNDWI